MKKLIALSLAGILLLTPLTAFAAEEMVVEETVSEETVNEETVEKTEETSVVEENIETPVVEDTPVVEENPAIIEDNPVIIEEMPTAIEETSIIETVDEVAKEEIEKEPTPKTEEKNIIEEIIEIIEEPVDLTNALETPETKTPSIEDNSWDNYAISYDYNYDTSSAAQWGAWGGNAGLTGQRYEDTNNNDISNKIGLYTNGDKVKVYVGYAGLFNGAGNGNDYNITIDGQNAKYRIVLEDGTDLSGAYLTPGTYKLKVINGDGSISGSEVAGATGYIVIKERNAYNEMEFEIPVSAIKEQNSNVNEHFSKVDFYSPNIMSRGPVSCGGASTKGAGLIGVFFALLGII